MIVGGQHVRQSIVHQIPGSIAPARRHEQRVRIDLHQRPELLPPGNHRERADRIALRMGHQWHQARLQQVGQGRRGRPPRYQAGELHQDVASSGQGDSASGDSPRGQRPIEHDLRTPMERDAGRRLHRERRHRLIVFRWRPFEDSARLEVRCQHDVGDSLGGHSRQHRHRLLDGPRPVIDAGQQVTMKVDHGAPLSRSRSPRANRSKPLGSASTCAASATVTNASAASRSRAAPRSAV